MPLPKSADESKISRRASLQIGAASAAAGLFAVKELATPAEAKDPPRGPTTPAFMDELPVYKAKEPVDRLSPASTERPNVSGGECGREPHQRRGNWPAQKFYTLETKVGKHRFHAQLEEQEVWGYDGILPGPTFVARYGEPIIVRNYNKLPTNSVGFGSPEISTHLHNLHCGSESDGYAGDWYSADPLKGKGDTLTAPGGYKDHHYPNCYAGYDAYDATDGDPREALGTLWYHDHREFHTAANCYKGLFGSYLLFDKIDSGNELDPNPGALRLPSGVGIHDIPLVFHDVLLDASGRQSFDPFENKGNLGNKFCVNGKIQPYFQVKKRKYRFRLLDASLSRFYEFYLTDASGKPISMTYIANDGNLLPAPLATSKVRLAPAERADIVIDFSSYAIGTQLFIVNRLIQVDGRGPEGPEVNVRGANGLLTSAGTRILRFDVVSEAPEVWGLDGLRTRDPSRVPAELRKLPDIVMSEVVARRTFEFDKVNEVWTVNGKIFDVNTPVVKPKRGTAEIWTLKGKGSWHHPVHIHLEEGRILTRNGVAPPLHERGRKDVYVLEPGEEVRIFIRFRDFTGKYMMHCHNLTHEDHAMMIRFDVEA